MAQPVLIGDAVGTSFRVSPSMLLQTACLTAKRDGCWIRIAGLEITIKILESSFSLGGGLDWSLAGFWGRLPSLSFCAEIWGSLATSA
jgi:hypothetical protein